MRPKPSVAHPASMSNCSLPVPTEEHRENALHPFRVLLEGKESGAASHTELDHADTTMSEEAASLAA